MAAAIREAFSQAAQPTRATLDQLAPAQPSAQPDPVILILVGGRITTARLGAGMVFTQTPVGPVLSAQQLALAHATAAPQTDGSFQITATPADLWEVFRNGVLQTAGLDYTADATKTKIVPSATFDAWNKTDNVQVSYFK
jgi:hypothetical protein